MSKQSSTNYTCTNKPSTGKKLVRGLIEIQEILSTTEGGMGSVYKNRADRGHTSPILRSSDLIPLQNNLIFIRNHLVKH